jgi:hypothetical protein
MGVLAEEVQSEETADNGIPGKEISLKEMRKALINENINK